MFEVCYQVKSHMYDEGEWETYAMCDTLEEAHAMYAKMKSEKAPGDFIEDENHYIDMIAIYNGDEKIESEW